MPRNRLRFAVMPCAVAAASLAQTPVKVQVALDKPINIMTVQAMGVYTDMYDGGFAKPTTAAYMHTAGMYTLEFPGGYGSYPDLYHWTTNSGTKYENFVKQESFFTGEFAMGKMTATIDKTGTAIVVVNYGSNMAGTGGGEPNEAAAWVAYTNGDPSDTKVIGKDSTGTDWKTVGYWAGLRAAEPLAQDDGMNLLRAGHPKPLAIKLWQVGSEVYNNGYYGGDHKLEEDLHAPYPASENDNEKRKRNPNLSPAFYGQRLTEFSKAMKNVDPNVWVGATLNLAPIDSAWGPEWNAEVLKAGCRDIDFVAYAWRPDFKNPPDYKVRDDAQTLTAPETQLGQIFKETLYNEKKFCPSGHEPRVAFTSVSPIHYATVINPLADGLFAADAFALLIESGTINSDWNELKDGYFLRTDLTPGPAFYGLQMLHIVAFRPGDKFVTTTASSDQVAAHAVQRQDGSFGLMLVNKSPTNSAEVSVSVPGGALAQQGSRFDYGPDNFKVNGPVTKSVFKSGGNTFSVSVPPYTITDIVLLKATTP